FADRAGGAAGRGRLHVRRDQGAVSVGRRDHGGGVMKVVVAVGGASGSIYAKRLLDELAALLAARRAADAVAAKTGAKARDAIEVGLVFSSAGNEGVAHEIGEVPAYSSFKRYGLRDFRAPFASGSAGWD